jgi:Xaa-Pro aminopeptidase
MSSVSSSEIGTKMYFPRDEYVERWARLEAELKRTGYDAAVLWQRTGGSYDRAGDVWYLSGYASHSSGQEPSSNSVGRSFAALLVRVGHEPELHIAEPVHTVDRRYVAVEDIYAHDEDLATGLGTRLKELGVTGRVAYAGDDFLPILMFRLLSKATPEIEWVPEEYLLFEIQNHKSELELDLYREGGEVASRALTALMEGLIKGERQCDAAAKAAAIIVGSGGGFQRIGVHTGDASELAMWDFPLYGYSSEAAQPGDMVRAWVYGPIRGGYWLDPGRSSVCGTPSPERKRLVESGAALTQTVMDAIKPGVTPREVGAAGDAFVKQLGYSDDKGGAIWDLYGHSISTFWLGPNIPAFGAHADEGDPGWWNVDRPFHEGQVYTAETFTRDPGVGTATFEEVFIVHESGLEVLSTTPMVFW